MEPRATSLLQIVDRQVRRWEFLREERRASAKRVHWPIITIAREFGARGEALGRTLAEGIDFSFWDQELVHAMAEESGANEAFLATVDEYRRNVIEDSVDGALMGGKYMNSAYNQSFPASATSGWVPSCRRKTCAEPRTVDGLGWRGASVSFLPS